MPRLDRRAILGASLLVLGLAACGGVPEAEEPAGPPPPPVEARASVDPAVATTGDVITYTVIVEHDDGLEIVVPEAGAEIAGFRILDVGSEPAEERSGRIVERRWYKLRADLVGSYVLPPIRVAWRPTSDTAPSEDGAAEASGGVVETSEIFVEVESVLGEAGDATDIRDVKDLRRVAEPVPLWVWLVLAGGSVFFLGLGGWVLWLFLRARPAAPPIPAHELAFQALAALSRTDFSNPDAVRLYFFQISEVLRGYVEARFGLNATDLTTEEILAKVSSLGELSSDQRASLERFLETTDRVKFAAHEPGEPEIEEAYERALSFVEATRPTETASEVAGIPEPEAAGA